MGKVSLKSIKSIVIASACLCALGCIPGIAGNPGSNAPMPSAPDEDIEQPTYVDDIPRVRPGVVLNVAVGAPSQKPNVMQVQVDENGEVTLPYLLDPATIKCDGKTLDEFKQVVLARYSEYIRQPVVNVAFGPFDIASGVSPYGTVLVMGEVESPGPVNMPATRDLTVTKVIKLAGGLRQFADKGKIVVSSCNREGVKRRTIVNIKEIGKNGDASKDIHLRAGDVVYVPETWY